MTEPNACGPKCGCHSSAMPRRNFLALSGLTLLATALEAWPMPVMAGPFEAADFAALVPPDKKLNPVWARSLFARGEPEVYTKKRGELRFIGMPVGGLCCGTLYLGGDGRLWLWDIFNQNQEGVVPQNADWVNFSGQKSSVPPRDGASYVAPHEEQSPLEQGFALRVNGVTRPFNAEGWEDIAFTGEYPLGKVEYADPTCPVAVTLTAYSPFVPLNTEDSSLPATICEFTLKNVSARAVEAELAGWLENACSLHSAQPGVGSRINAVQTLPGLTLIASRFDQTLAARPADARPDIVIDDFERDIYAPWTAIGEAFGKGPIARADIPGYEGDVGGVGSRVVNSHASAPGGTIEEKDSRVGTLTSPAFMLDRQFLTFWIGGGANADEVGLRLIVDGKTVRRAAGRKENLMRQTVFHVAEFAGKTAAIEIYDHGTGAWGNVGVDDIILTDHPPVQAVTEQDRDFGTLALALLGSGTGKAGVDPQTLFDAPAAAEARKTVGEKLIGALTQAVSLAPGQSQTVTFALAWHFPNSGLNVPGAETGNYYAQRFADAPAVAQYVAQNYPRLSADTKLWHATWNDSTLPRWFLSRTFANTSILATTTAHRFGTGRFWGWEGVGCCEGTCTHVWHYAQAVGRIFPELERITREHVDFGTALYPDGVIGYRGEGTGPAVDGQCGRILGAYREHQMSADSGFLRRLWPNVRKAMEAMMRHDHNGDGLLDGAQENTLDAAWYGEIAWISSLYAAALRACAKMASEMDDTDFAQVCRAKSAQTRQAIETQLFNGEWFIQKPEPGRESALGTYQTCHIDQVQGQSWAWQVNLGRILDRDKTVSALRALYKYNFAPDVGPFRHHNTAGRPYALAGDGGLIMATNPQDLPHPYGNSSDWQFGYFNECMSGFEHQVASHMIAEGLVEEGLAVTRAIHDRYHAARRNPYNEVECSDHYARAMASYGSFVSLCGFECHGPNGHLGFAPRLTPENFRAPFTAPEGWGTFTQKAIAKTLQADITLRHGRLRLKTLALAGNFRHVTAHAAGHPVTASVSSQDGRAMIVFGSDIILQQGQNLTATLS